jgi:hypothetical protein
MVLCGRETTPLPRNPYNIKLNYGHSEVLRALCEEQGGEDTEMQPAELQTFLKALILK